MSKTNRPGTSGGVKVSLKFLKDIGCLLTDSCDVIQRIGQTIWSQTWSKPKLGFWRWVHP